MRKTEIAKILKRKDCNGLIFALVFSWSGLIIQTLPSLGDIQRPPVHQTREEQLDSQSVNLIAQQPGKTARPSYYVEFRSRSGPPYGHSYMIFGQLNRDGTIKTRDYAGLYPSSEFLLYMGHTVPVSATTTGHPLDHDDTRLTASMRINLSASRYKDLVALVLAAQDEHPLWQISLNNCNNFIGSIAQKFGLQIPPSTLILPQDYVKALKQLNSKTQMR